MTTPQFHELVIQLQRSQIAPTLGRHMGPGYALPNTIALLRAVQLTAAEEIRNLGLQDAPNPINALIPTGANHPMYARIFRAIEQADANTAFTTHRPTVFAPDVRVRLANHRDADLSSIDDIPIGTLGTITGVATDDDALHPAWNVQWDDGWGLYWTPEYNMVISND